MPMLPEFRLETHFSKWEFKARYHLTASDAEAMSMRDLLAMATPEEREAFEGMWLGYTETFGAQDLREEIAKTYDRQSASDILCFAGASEGIFAANQVILEPDSHAIVVTPNYQSHSACRADTPTFPGSGKDRMRRCLWRFVRPQVCRWIQTTTGRWILIRSRQPSDRTRGF